MEAAEPIVRRRVRRFWTMEEKRLIVEETRRAGVSVAAVAQAHGINANQVFSWRKLEEAGLLTSAGTPPPGEPEPCSVRLLPVTVDEGVERQGAAASPADVPSCGPDAQVIFPRKSGRVKLRRAPFRRG